jgi:periplasmic mercuric ion binding protein
MNTKNMTGALTASLLAMAIGGTPAMAQDNGPTSDTGLEVTLAADIVLRVDGLACPFCAHGLEQKLSELDATDRVEVKLNEGEVFLFLKADQDVADEALTKAVTDAGFVVRSIRRAEDDA